VNIDTLSLDDLERCMDLAEQVGWPREHVKWNLLLSLGRGYGTRDGDALSSMVVITPHDEGSFVAMMVVDPARQGTGLGRVLLEHALEEAPTPVMLYATPAGRPLYEKLGFVEVDRVRKMSGWLVAEESYAATPDRDAILELDARAFGIRRTRVMSALLEVADHVVQRDGFALRFNNGAINVIGPVVAPREEAAIELINAVIAGVSGRTRIDVAESSPKVIAHMQSLGFEDHGPAPFMTYPQADLRGARRSYHAIALQAFG
jgi:GNAT superfamily N-acetyltransferase